jgi:acyl-CoA-dependent ceramide synthase
MLAQCAAITRPFTRRFTSLSYLNPKTGEYGVGFDDNYLVVVLIVLLTGLRDATMRFILGPIASMWGLSREKSMRFKEQAWLFVYYSACWSVGMVCFQLHLPSFC